MANEHQAQGQNAPLNGICVRRPARRQTGVWPRVTFATVLFFRRQSGQAAGAIPAQMEGTGRPALPERRHRAHPLPGGCQHVTALRQRWDCPPSRNKTRHWLFSLRLKTSHLYVESMRRPSTSLFSCNRAFRKALPDLPHPAERGPQPPLSSLLHRRLGNPEPRPGPLL